MGLSYSAARLVAPASFIYDFAAQQYGLNSTPSMKDVNDANLSFWSPQPYFIGAFFFPQQFFQLAWLYKLWKMSGKVKSGKATATEKKEVDEMVQFVPFYVIGNICIGTWMFFWNASMLKAANVFVWVNSLSQLYYIFFKLQPMNTKSWPSILTHVAAKSFAGIGVLDFLHNTSVAYFKDELPGIAIKVLTGLGFAGLAAGSDWIFGGCLVYDLVALSVGQRQIGNGDWSNMLGGFAVGTAAIVGLRNYLL